MSAGFQVILSDLDDMAGTFTSEVGTSQSLILPQQELPQLFSTRMT